MKFLKIISQFLLSPNLTQLNKKIIWFSFIGSFLSFFAITISDGIMNKLGKIDYYEVFLFSKTQNENNNNLKTLFLNELNYYNSTQKQKIDLKSIYFSPTLINNAIYEVQGLKNKDVNQLNLINYSNFDFVLKDFEISISGLFAYKNGLNIGDKIRLFSFEKTYTPLGKIFINRLFTIKHIHKLSNHQRFFINEESFQRLFKVNSENAILFNNLNEKNKFETFTQHFLQKNKQNNDDLELFNTIHKKNDNLQSAIEMEKFLIKFLTGFLLLISLSVLYNSTLLMKQTKQHDIFILKTMGYNRYHINFIFISVNLIILSLSLLFSFISAILFLEFIMPHILIFKEYQLDLQYLFTIIVFSFLITIFISIFSIKINNKK